MTISAVTKALLPLFRKACCIEHVFGSKIQTALLAYGLEDLNHRFWLVSEGDEAIAALYLFDHVLLISSQENMDAQVVCRLVHEYTVKEIDCCWTLCEALHRVLGGYTESSNYMRYDGEHLSITDHAIRPGHIPAVFQVLQQSHEYYRTHLDFRIWSADVIKKQETGSFELYQLELNGQVVGTGSIASQDEDSAVIAAVAVIPAYRHQGLGSRISLFLVQRIQELGKTPRLISGYDEVAELYKKIGFVPCGRWGELYLDA